MFRGLFLLILPLSVIFSDDIYPGDSIVHEGVYAFYNYEFDRGISILSQARIDYPDHPGVHLIWAAARWVRSQAYDSVNETHIVLETDLMEIKPIYENLISRYPQDPVYQLYQGSSVGLSARVTLGRKEWLKTLYRAYSGFSIIGKVSAESPHLKDASLAIGIVEYYAGISNILLKWAVNFYGLNASSEGGLNTISIAANESDWAWIEAKGILSFLYLWVEDEPELAYEYSSSLVEHFPKNYYFNLLLLESMIRTNYTHKSLDQIKEIDNLTRDLTDRQKDWYGPYLDYEKALLAFHSEQFAISLDLLEKAISSYSAELDIILGNAYLLKGMTLDKMNNRTDAISAYKKCLKLDNFSSAMKKAKHYLNQPYQKY